MAITSIEQLRSIFPPELRNLGDEDLVRRYAESWGTSPQPMLDYLGIKPRGTLGEMGRQFVGGAVVDLPSMVGQGLKYVSTPGEQTYETGQGLVSGAQSREALYAPDDRGRGVVGRSLTMGARALAPVVPVIGASMIPGVGEVAGPAAAAALFGPSSAQDTYEKLIGQGRSEYEARAAARSVGLIQGVGEAAGTAIGARFLKAAGPLFGAGTTEKVAARLTDTGVLRPALTEFGKQMIIQPGTEVLQDVGSSVVEGLYGAKPENLLEIAKDSAMGAAGLTTILGPLSIFGHRARAQRAENLKDALYGENTPLDVRTAAIDIVRNEAARQGVKPENVESWFDQQLQMEDARNAELARRAAIADQERTKKLVGLVAEQRGVTEQDLMTPGLTSAGLIDKTMGIGRETPKGYAEQFAAAYNEPSGRRVVDPKTGLERELTAGEAQLLNAGLASEIDLTSPAPKATVTAETQKAGITAPTEEQKKEEAPPVNVDENRAFFRDELLTPYTDKGQTLLNYIRAANLDPRAAELAPIWSAVPDGVLRDSQLNKLKGEVDKLIIASKKAAAGIAPTVPKSTPSQRAADAAAAAAAENQARIAEKDAAQLKALQDLAAQAEANGTALTRGQVMGQLKVDRTKADELLKRLEAATTTQAAPTETAVAATQPMVTEETSQTVAAPDLAATTAAPATELPAFPAFETAAAPAATSTEPVISRKSKKRVVTPAAPAAAYVAPEAEVAPEVAPEAPQDVGLSEENQRDIAELTGSLDTAQEEQGAEAPVGQDIDEAAKAQIIADRFAASKSKDPARDAEILDAYISAVQKAPDKSATAIQTAIGAKYGIGAQAVRKIGNLTPLVEAGVKQGFTAEQVRQAFGIPDTTKGGPTEIGALQAELAAIRKDLKTVPSEKKGALIAKAASLAEQIQKLETQADVAEKESFAQAVQETTGGTIEGETAGMGFDDARLWSQPENQLEALSQALVNISNKEQDLQELLSEYTEQNLPDAVAAVQTQIQKVQAEFQQTLADIKAAEDKAKGNKNAVQESGAKTVSVQSGTTGGKGVRKQNAQGQKAAGKGKAETKVQEVTKTPEEQWAALSAQAAKENIQLPAYESLTPAQKSRFDDLAKRGEATLASVSNSILKASDVQAVSPKGAAERTDGEAAPSVKFGKGGAVKNPYTVKDLVQDLKDFVRVDVLGRKLIVVQSVDELTSNKDPDVRRVGEKLKENGAFGVATGGRAYLIADRIAKGQGRAKFMHEVGAHLGLENLLTPKAYKELVDQVKGWEKRSDNSIEARVAKKARARLEAAETPEQDVDAELLAYTLEEAILAGVEPTANKLKGGSELQSWFRTVWSAFKNAVRKLGFSRELTVQDLVNLGFGAARLEINGTWHGTAASFRNFNNKYIGSGEGTQAFGWGSYVAQLMKIGESYRRDDVFKKGTGSAGSLMRVDTAINNENSINLDKPLNEQSETVDKALSYIFDGLETEFFDAFGYKFNTDNWRDLDTTDIIGRSEDNVGAIAALLKEGIYPQDPATRAAIDEGLYQKAASMYLNSLGVRGVKFFDRSSRSVAEKFKAAKAVEKLLVADKAEAEAAIKANDNPENRARLEEVNKLIEDNDKLLVRAANRTQNTVVFTERNMQRVSTLVGGERDNMRFGKNSPTQSQIQKAIAALPKAAQQPVRNSLAALTQDVTGKLLDRVVFTGDLVKRAVAAGITSASKFERLINASKTEARDYERAVEKVADMYALVPQDERGLGPKSVSRFLFDSTRELKWGYGQNADPDMKARFDKLSKESQELVKAIFKHGADVLAQKKKVVLDAAASEYDAMIKASEEAGDTEAVDRLKKEKQATLKRFNTLFAIREGKPYAPIKRTGNYVVIAKSQEYRDAEAANDKKKLAELEKDSDHYHVTFKDSKAEALTLQAQLVNQGFFGGENAVQVAERDQLVDEMYGNTTSLRELTKIRARVEQRVAGGDATASSRTSSASIMGIINQMYLEALAEGSARKSEMKRRGVDGEVDMLQSFAQQGRADAQFMAAVKYNPQIQDALQAMRNESKSGDRMRKSELLNELGKRYLESMDYAPKPWLDKLTRMSSVYFLATSPSYYLQNLTQPWVMSVPAMAGRHDYLKSSGALYKAYTELGGVMKSAKLLKQQFDFDKVPADVRDAIKELVNRGKIDIGLDTEIGQFRVEGEGVVREKINAADKALRLAVQKVESVNRLSTAMAAYRLELAKTGNKEAALEYADRILTETHGDYTAFNAPRVFNSSIGKVALQFRKFQLIQLGFYAKLLKDALQGKDRAVALKTLGYSLGHTAMLAGVTGLPGYMAISAVLGMLFGDDDKDFDTTQELRKAIGDEQLANLILKGAPTLVGADISGKVGAGSMLSVLPFSNADITTKSGMAEAFGTLVGGAALGMTIRMADGLTQMLNGDWYKGLEQVMPKGVGDAMKAYRVYNEGLTKRNNDVVLSADDVSEVTALWQAIGVSPVKTSVVYEQQRAFASQTDKLTARTTEIKQDYAKAYRAKDSEDMAEARAEWNKLQDTRRSLGYPRQSMSELLKAPMEQRKREKATVEGIQYTKGTRTAARQFVTEE